MCKFFLASIVLFKWYSPLLPLSSEAKEKRAKSKESLVPLACCCSSFCVDNMDFACYKLENSICNKTWDDVSLIFRKNISLGTRHGPSYQIIHNGRFGDLRKKQASPFYPYSARSTRHRNISPMFSHLHQFFLRHLIIFFSCRKFLVLMRDLTYFSHFQSISRYRSQISLVLAPCSIEWPSRGRFGHEFD